MLALAWLLTSASAVGRGGAMDMLVVLHNQLAVSLFIDDGSMICLHLSLFRGFVAVSSVL